MYPYPTKTSLVVWSENPNGLSQELRENLEIFMSEIIGDIEEILTLPSAPELTREWKQAQWFQDIREIPNWEQIKAWKEKQHQDDIEKQRVEYFLKRNVIKIHDILERHKKAA